MIEIDCADAFEWLPRHAFLKPALITSLPDAEELNMELADWITWFEGAITACLDVCSAPAVFYQTDRKANRRLYSKAALLFGVAEREGWYPLWHKIAFRVPPGKTSLYRPSYSHVIAFSPDRRYGPGLSSPDIIDRGPVYHANGAGENAARMAMLFLASCEPPAILNPFCGYGTFLRAGQSLDIDLYGCELDEMIANGARGMLA